MNKTIDSRIPKSAPWKITDDTENMYELRFSDNPGVPEMVYKGAYSTLCQVFDLYEMQAEDARKFLKTHNPPDEWWDNDPFEALQELDLVAIDRARFERLMTFAHAFKNAPYEEHEDVLAAFDALQPGDLDPIP